jgi:hypothetical protein
MLWLGERVGYVPDAITQLWVRATGRQFSLRECPWLDGPIGDTRRIGRDFFERIAPREGGSIRVGSGLLPDVSALIPGMDPAVADFYQNTAAYRVDAWSEWDGMLKPFGVLLAQIFSRRLEQLNVPLDNMETSRGMTSDIFDVLDANGDVKTIAWVRTLAASGRTIYCGSYSTCRVPGFDGNCLKVSFPLPNGNATVILFPEVRADGSLVLTSRGDRFGDPGFYFVWHSGNRPFARYVRAMRERIHVYRAGDDVRTDHELWFFGRRFLRLHYRLTKSAA